MFDQALNIVIYKAFVGILEPRKPVFIMRAAAMIAKFLVFIGAVIIPA